MPDKTGRFTGTEEAFIEAMAAYGNRPVAAREAGLVGSGSPSKLMSRPAVVEAIGARIQANLERLAPKAFNVLEWAMTDERVPANARIKASTYVIDNLKGSGAEDGKAPDEMTAEELAAFAQRARLQLAAAEDRLADQAKDISPKTDESILD